VKRLQDTEGGSVIVYSSQQIFQTAIGCTVCSTSFRSAVLSVKLPLLARKGLAAAERLLRVLVAEWWV